MIVPQPTAQYGQVERVSFARAIFNTRSCAYAGFKSKPKTAAAAPPTVVSFRKSRRVGFLLGPLSARGKVGSVSQNLLNKTYRSGCHAVIFANRAVLFFSKIPYTQRLTKRIQRKMPSTPPNGPSRFSP